MQMMVYRKKSARDSVAATANKRIVDAASFVIEQMESRVLMSTTITAWNFNSLTSGATNLTPAPSTGTGSAVSIGMTSTSGSGAFPAVGASSGADTSNILSTTKTADQGSSDPGVTNVWRVVGSNGWNTAAGIGTQGAQFLASTSGFNAVSAKFDIYLTTAGEGKFQVQYTTDGSSWNNISASKLNIGANSGISTIDNSAGTIANTVAGGFFSVTGGQAWYNGLTADLSGIPGATDNSNFGIRIVNAATGVADTVSNGTTLENNTSGNWRLDEVQINGNGPSAPAVTSNPTSQTVSAGTPVTFTAAASGFPVPAVQWYVGTPGSGTAISGQTSASYTFTPTAAQTGNTYYAVFTNGSGNATTTAATLTVTTVPIITTQPVSQTVSAGAAVTFTAAATGNPTPTVQWSVKTPGAGNFSPIGGATSTTYSIPAATESLTGNQYEAIFTSGGSTTTSAATLTVLGTPIAQWNFTAGEAPPAGGSTVQGTGNAPLATFGPTTNTAGTLGLQNDYTGVQAFPESDILLNRSTLNSKFAEYTWRVRSGNGQGPTGSPGSPEGWSQNAPQYAEGVVFAVSTQGYSNVTLHYDWTQGGIADMQAQYSGDGGQTWTNAPNGLIESTAKDYYGITASTNPTGILINLQGIAAANDNPNFQLRLVAAYNPNLPSITDGNQLVPTVHGQYAAAGAPGPVNAQQVLQFNSGISNGDTFSLNYNGTPVNVVYSSTASTLISNVNAALTTLVGTGNFSVAQTNYTTGGALLQPLRDGLGNQDTDLTVTFKGTLAATAVSTLTTTNANLVIATWVNGSTSGLQPYVDGGGAWNIGNFSFNGDSSKSGALAITANPSSATGTVGFPVTFTSTAYSETPGVTAQWYDNGASIPNATTITGTGPNYSSTYTFNPSLSQNGHLITCVFTVGTANATSQAATLTVVSPSAPVVVIPPINASAQAGKPTVFTSTATGSPAPTVQWQISTDGGTSWTNLVNSATVSGATSTTLQYTASTDASDNGDKFRAVFTNQVAPTNSAAATLHVLTAETVLTAWDFSKTYPTVDGSKTTADPYVNSPAPVAAGVDSSIGISGTASAIGFDLPFNPSDPATGVDGNGSANEDDIVNTAGLLNTSFNENTWRIRGGVPVSPTQTPVGGTPANGWSNFAAPYTQGAQFSVPTTGYANGYVTMDWNATTSGELDAQPQYTTDGTNWINLGNQIQAVSGDYYGATAGGGTVPLVFDVSGIAGTANNPNFGIRLVNAYNPSLSNTQTLQLGDTHNFQLTFTNVLTGATSTTASIAYSSSPTQMAANVQAALGALADVGSANLTVTSPSGQASVLSVAFSGLLSLNAQRALTFVSDASDTVTTNFQYANAQLAGTPPSPVPYNGSKGNWRFDNIVFHGDPTWLDPTSNATWNESTQQLTINGPAKIIADPQVSPIGALATASNDLPTILGSTAASALKFSPTSNSTTFFHIGGLTLSNGATADLVSLGASRTHDNHNVLVVGTTSATSAPTFSIDSANGSKLDMEDNDLIVHNGNFATIQDLARVGRNGTTDPNNDGTLLDGTWNGNGLTSSAAAAQAKSQGVEYTALAAVEVQDLNDVLGGPATWNVGSSTENLSATDTIVKYTYIGDWTLAGKVADDASTVFTTFFGHTAPFSDLFPETHNDDHWAAGSYNGGALNDDAATVFTTYFGNGDQSGPLL